MTQSAPGLLAPDDFARLVAHAPLVAIDLLVCNAGGALLVGYRQNRPAASSWFVPGGRIRKGETLDVAFQRITEAELGLTCQRSCSQFIGVFEHFYDDSAAGPTGEAPSTHYIVLAHQIVLSDAAAGALTERLVSIRDQHARWRWVDPRIETDWLTVHPNTRAYGPWLRVPSLTVSAN